MSYLGNLCCRKKSRFPHFSHFWFFIPAAFIVLVFTLYYEKKLQGERKGGKTIHAKSSSLSQGGSWMGVRIVSRCLPYSSTDFPSILVLIFLLPSDKNVGGQRSNGCPKKRDKIRGFCDLRTSK